ncbi:hypothetical protein tinsulaeT_37020 [Thalassotalea insulae]|uniref:DUF3540 domain-containing protein n=1 Tax=Thalassotalea insulae TaxID=2056778 RepID=A0ABQ6GYF9_9GAMM|nr:DUF3540 domain-containing protein [Thalassotalea insulae]GLX80362.1 hypothetical protein tinsulaeT_37020 [Thalassotalea insulae]
MKSSLKLAQVKGPKAMPNSYIGKITAFDKQQQCWMIDNQFPAKKALSLLVNPELSDQVSFIELDEEFVITQLLTRANSQLQITMQSDKSVQWILPELSVKALDSLELVASNNVTLMANNLVQNGLNSLMQYSENLLQQANQFSATAKGVLRLNGKQQIITADDDVRIDGERINIG